MVCLAYNIGPADLRTSTLLARHKAKDYAGAQEQFARWNKANGQVMAGLVRRRAAEAALYGRAS
jgi:GH24 family phage-related lysozyme (muramidase)